MSLIKNSLLISIALISITQFGVFILNNRIFQEQPLPEVNVVKYLGLWYEIAEIPFFWGKDCHCSNAYYELIPETGKVLVNNSCSYYTPNNTVSYWVGEAWLADGSTAKLKVKFPYIPHHGNYWILDVDDDDYSYALVGHPTKQYLWVLSRTPTLNETIYERLVQKGKELGYPVEKIKRIDQSCGIPNMLR